MNIPWEDVRLFLAIAEEGSLSGAARRLRTTQPTVTRRLAELEDLVGEPLFQRGIQGARLTTFGERLVDPAKRMAEWASEIERAADGAGAAPRGTVRLTAPPGMAFDFVAPFAGQLRARLPEVRLEVVATIQYVDLVRREADLAIRMERPVQRDLVTLAEHEADVAAFASPRYVARLPRGYGAADVDWIGWAPPLDHMSPNRELAALIPGFRPVFASDDYLVQLRAAAAGLGAMFLPRTRHPFDLFSDLVELDLDFGKLRGAIHVVSTRSALAIPRVRAVADLLTAELAKVERLPPRRPAGKAAPAKRAGV